MLIKSDSILEILRKRQLQVAYKGTAHGNELRQS